MNLASVALAAVVVVWVGTGTLVDGDGTNPSLAPSPTSVEQTTAPAPVEDATSGLRGYALALPEVDGLPPDLEHGARLDLWVSWDPSVSDEPTVQKLIQDVVYDRTIPPSVDGGPLTAMILVPPSKVDELMYGDRFGSLSATLVRD